MAVCITVDGPPVNGYGRYRRTRALQFNKLSYGIWKNLQSAQSNGRIKGLEGTVRSEERGYLESCASILIAFGIERKKWNYISTLFHVRIES